MDAKTPCPQGRTDYEACFAPFRYCPEKGCGRMEEIPPKPAPDFNRDPEALAWARAKVERVIEKMRRFEAQAKQQGTSDPEFWRKVGNMLHREFVGGVGCPTAAFDPRLPERLDMLDRSSPATEGDF